MRLGGTSVKIGTIYVRFYKSFNIDYLRKAHGGAKHFPWELLGDRWEPFVRIPLDPSVTAVVGANESGKSHLLSAIEKILTGNNIGRSDFCRYSPYFAVQQDRIRLPDFGIELTDLSDDDVVAISAAAGLPADASVDRVWFFRANGTDLAVYLRDATSESGYSQHILKPNQGAKLSSILPSVFRIDSDVPLPESVPLQYLIEGPRKGSKHLGRRRGTHDRIGRVITEHQEWFSSATAVQQARDAIASAVAPLLQATEEFDQQQEQQYQLADKLLCNVARIERTTFRELYDAIEVGEDGYVNGIVQQINAALETTLNFPSWWEQDREFQLLVTPREHDLAFTIRDRTGTEYSFRERSAGLKYFLSYYVQFLAHEAPSGRGEILLMDEPDAYLSSQGQQDLLKLFERFAYPDDGRTPVQVVYVTHSPFLINKNHGERIRVLEKGIGDEGTRVVRDAARNHYEPLRSSIGAFVAETAFIGTGNLIVEGLADQVLLAGATAFLRSRGVPSVDTLDLNRLTIVPAGSASHVPYLVYLARGRDVEQPAITVLLDSDSDGNKAKQGLQAEWLWRKARLKEEYIFQVGDLRPANDGELRVAVEHVTELEDLVPIEICARAATAYLQDIIGVADATVSATDIKKRLMKSESSTATIPLFDAVEGAMAAVVDSAHLDKVAFARCVIDDVRAPDRDGPEVENFESNFRLLFRELGKRVRDSERERNSERASRRVDRAIKGFLRDHPLSARGEDVHLLIDEIDAALDDSAESDTVRVALQAIRRDYVRDDDLTHNITGYEGFKDRLTRVKYAGRLASHESIDEMHGDAPS
jgi:predicted ATPase